MGKSSTDARVIPILHAIAAVALALWLAVVVLWPWISGGARDGWTRDVEVICQRYFCHRMPSRSLAWNSTPLLVCARCTGVIAGYMLGAVAALCGAERLPLWRFPWALLMIAWMGVSWLAGWLGWLRGLEASSRELWHAERVFAGVCGGFGGYILISCCVVWLIHWVQRHQLESEKGAAA